MPVSNASLQQRLDRNTQKVAKLDACWPWTGLLNSKGYGYLSFKGRNYRAHRLAWEAVHGPIPDGQIILHRCDNPRCVNPAHLSAGTHADNVHDMEGKHRACFFGRQRHALHVRSRQAIAEHWHDTTALDVHDVSGLA